MQPTHNSRPQTAPLSITPGNAQHQGDRDQQQDNFGFSNLADPDLLARAGALAVVADGMGGHVMGQEASRLAKEIFLNGWPAKLPDESIPNALWRLLQQANEGVRHLAQEQDQMDNVGTTLTAAVIHQDCLYWIAVGDSHIYLYRNGQLTLLNSDHVYARELAQAVAEGTLTQEEANQNPNRDALTSFLGLPELTEVDYSQRPFPSQAGDCILLCSDGLYQGLSEAEIIEDLGQRDPQTAAESLVSRVLAKRYPHQDNITAVILACDAPVVSPNRKRLIPWLGAIVLAGVVAGVGWWQWPFGEQPSSEQETVVTETKQGKAQKQPQPATQEEKPAADDEQQAQTPPDESGKPPAPTTLPENKISPDATNDASEEAEPEPQGSAPASASDNANGTQGANPSTSSSVKETTEAKHE